MFVSRTVEESEVGNSRRFAISFFLLLRFCEYDLSVRQVESHVSWENWQLYARN